MFKSLVLALVLLLSVSSRGQVIEVSETTVNFGDTSVGEPTYQIITLSNKDANRLEITSITTSDSIFRVLSPRAPVLIDSGKTEILTLEFKPIASGPQSAVMIITSNANNESNKVITLIGNIPTNLTQEEIMAVISAAEAIRDSTKIIYFGLSVSGRYIAESFKKDRGLLRNATISIDTTLQVDPRDRGDIILSGVVIAYPFHTTRSKFWRNFGFMANVNIADFTSESITINNKSIEGGLGLAYKLHENFSLGLTFERVFSRKLRGNIQPGEKYPPGAVGDELLTQIDVSDERFFVDDNLTAFSFGFIFVF